MSDQYFGRLCRGRRSQKSGHTDFGMWTQIWSVLHLSSGASANTASAACPAQSSNLAITPTSFAAVICDAEEPCSVKTAQSHGNRFSQSYFGARLGLHTLDTSVPISFF